MTVSLHVLTTQAPPTTRPLPCRSYICDHLECARERRRLHDAGAPVCKCSRPITYHAGHGETRCLCGRVARTEKQRAA